MAYGFSKPPGPRMETMFGDLLPHFSALRDGTLVQLQRVVKPDTNITTATSGSVCSDPNTYTSIYNLLNYEINQGNSYPFEAPLSREQFDEYFFGYDAFVLRTVEAHPKQSNSVSTVANKDHTATTANNHKIVGLPVSQLPDLRFVGCFYVKPNYPGRSAHLCNGGFLVSPASRAAGAGYILGERFRLIGQRLGYRGSIFNLVFHDNRASLRLWEKLGFTAVGTIPDAGRHPMVLGKNGPDDQQHYVAATMWFHDFTQPISKISLPWEAQYKDRIAAAAAAGGGVTGCGGGAAVAASKL